VVAVGVTEATEVPDLASRKVGVSDQDTPQRSMLLVHADHDCITAQAQHQPFPLGL
jgi:hypothetical protein